VISSPTLNIAQGKLPIPGVGSHLIDISLDPRSVSTAMTRKWRILLVDDDADFRQVFRSGLKKSGLNADLFDVKDGFAAINYLLGKEPYADREQFPFPDLAFIDLKMPRMDGLELLKRLQGKVGLQNLPVIVLTGSDTPADVASAYSAHASAFHHKPPDFDGLVAMLKTIVPLWINTDSNGENSKQREKWVFPQGIQ
jgi:CheY-like chemotaxis protein